jgi:geranylgeranyl pyrophosphate synthase
LHRILASTDSQKLAELRALLQSTEALAYARRQAERFAGLAESELEKLADSPARRALGQLTRFVVHRSA